MDVPVSRASAATSMRSTSIGISKPGREVAAELRVRVRIGAAKLMVQMRRPDDDEPFGLGDLSQREQQRDRIGAARQRDSHTGTRRKQSVIADSAADGIDDHSWVRSVRRVR